MKALVLTSGFIILFFFSSFAQGIPAMQWSKCFGGTKAERANDVLPVADGGFIVGGYSYSNDGNVTGHYGSTDSSDAWLFKIDKLGNLVWQKSLGGSGNDRFEKIISAPDGSYICVGTTSSNNGDVVGNHGGVDIWVVKINESGTILWSKCYGGSLTEIGGFGATVTFDKAIVITGGTNSNDGDVSGKMGATDVWVFKINLNGSIIWQKCFGNTSSDSFEYGDAIVERPDSNLYISFHPQGLGDYNVFRNCVHSTMLKKEDGSPPIGGGISCAAERSNVISGLSIANKKIFWLINSHPFVASLCTDVRSDIWSINNSSFVNTPGATPANCSGPSTSVGTYSSSFSGPNGIAATGDSSFLGAGQLSEILASAEYVNPYGLYGGTDGFIGFTRISSSGTNSFYKKFGGTANDAFLAIKPLKTTQEFVAAGSTFSNDIDVSGNHGSEDVWVVKFDSLNAVYNNRIVGEIYLDLNRNGVKDGADKSYKQALVNSSKIGYSWNSLAVNGMYSNYADTGTYTTAISFNKPYYIAIPASRQSVFTSYLKTDTINFALQPQPGKKDYRINLVSLTPARPGFNATYKILYENTGTDTLSNKPVKFVKDRRLSFLSAQPAQNTINGDTLIWNITSLLPGDTAGVIVQLKLAAPPLINNGDTLISRSFIDSSADLVTSDNSSLLRQLVTGAYDPNDKTSGFGAYITKEDVVAGKALSYTIRFQNTGTDTAFNIAIRDTLDAKLDWNSIQMISASHPYQLAIKDGKYCTWTFNNIMLPDSFRNERASHGYLAYSIQSKKTLNINDSIKNSASIYFDFNLPIKTNTATTVVKVLTVTPVIDINRGEAKILLFPNPVNNGKAVIQFQGSINGNVSITMTDITGRTLYQKQLGRLSTDLYNQQIDMSGRSAGVYFINIIIGNKSYPLKLVVQ